MPCNASAPELRTAYEQFKSKGLEILSISMSEKNAAVEEFISKYGLTYPFVMDRDGAAATLYGVVESPTTILGNCSGGSTTLRARSGLIGVWPIVRALMMSGRSQSCVF